MSAFDALFVKSYPYVDKFVESFRLPLGDIQNMWPKGEGPTVFFIYTLAFGHVTWPLALGFIQSVLRSGKYYSSLGHWHLDSSGALAFWEVLFVTCPLALGLIGSVLHSGKYYSLLGHWHLDSSGASCVPGSIIRHLAIGTWTYPERLAFQEILFVTWPLAIGLIRSVLRSGKYYLSLG
ncbi:hypothetical protein Tco_1232776, partial [Tanacetum coccineum]